MLLSIHRDDAILCVSTALLLQAIGASRMGYPPTILRMRSDPQVTHLWDRMCGIWSAFPHRRPTSLL
jgi:hypothetical protein